MIFEILLPGDKEEINEMSKMATAIVRDYYDPIIGMPTRILFSLKGSRVPSVLTIRGMRISASSSVEKR